MSPKSKKSEPKKIEIIKCNGKDNVICRIRKYQYIAKKEEIYRQTLLNKLIDELGYSEYNIGVEVPLAHYKIGARDRADIVIFDRPYNDAGAKPLILIECKDPENHRQTIHQYDIQDQAERYSQILKPIFKIVTNDRQITGKDNRNQKILDHIPTLEAITKDRIRYIKPKPYHWCRTTSKERHIKKVQKLNVKLGYIAEVTDSRIAPQILQLMDLIYDTASSFNKIVLSKEFVLKEDVGLRLSNFGYAGSGGLIGDYRCLRLEKPDGNSKIIGYSIYPQGSWGTYLMISVDDRDGHAIELQLDKFIKPTGETTYQIIHSGLMTVGKKGRLKNAVVLNYVAEKAPFLLSDGKVLLGAFNLNDDLIFQQKEVKDFVLRTATYAILRDQLRKEIGT